MNPKKLTISPQASLVLIFSIIFSFFQVVCKKPDDTEVIKNMISELVQLAEKKDRDKILFLLSDDCKDFEQRDIFKNGELIDYYFKNYKGIVIHHLDIFVSLNGDESQVETDVLLSSGPLETLRKLVWLTGSFYRFNFKLVRRGKMWKINYSAWQEINSNSLLPGSKVILKKTFSGFNPVRRI